MTERKHIPITMPSLEQAIFARQRLPEHATTLAEQFSTLQQTDLFNQEKKYWVYNIGSDVKKLYISTNYIVETQLLGLLAQAACAPHTAVASLEHLNNDVRTANRMLHSQTLSSSTDVLSLLPEVQLLHLLATQAITPMTTEALATNFAFLQESFVKTDYPAWRGKYITTIDKEVAYIPTTQTDLAPQLYAILIEQQIDPGKARLNFASLKSSQFYRPQTNTWVPSLNMTAVPDEQSETISPTTELLALLVAAGFDKEYARKRYTEMKREPFFNTEHNLWITEETRQVLQSSYRADAQLLDLLVQHALWDEQQTAPTPLPVVLHF